MSVGTLLTRSMGLEMHPGFKLPCFWALGPFLSLHQSLSIYPPTPSLHQKLVTENTVSYSSTLVTWTMYLKIVNDTNYMPRQP